VQLFEGLFPKKY